MNKIQRKKIDYSWVIIGLCFMSIFCGMGFCSSGRTLYLTAITGALDIPRGAFSLNNTFRFITTTIINLFFGNLIRKFGAKKLICAGFVSLIAFAWINSVATSLYAFYIAGIFLGIGIAWTGTTMMSYVVKKWCKKNVGTFTGAILAANGLGGAVAIQILSPIIFKEGDPFGYRTSYRIVSVILAVALLMIILFFKDKKDDEETENIQKKRKARGTGWIGMEYSEAIRKPYFYISLLCIFLIGMVLQGLSGIAIPHMYDIGMDVDFVALIASMSGLLLFSFKIMTGYLFDKVGMRLTMNICLVSAFISMFALVFLENSFFGKILAVIRTVFSGIAMPLETVMLPLFAMEFFGNKPFDKMVGLFGAASAAGFALGSPFGNLCYDIFGDYRIAFFVFSALMLVVTVLLQIILTLSNKEKIKIEQNQ